MEFIKELIKILLGVEPTPINIALVIGGFIFATFGLLIIRAISVRKGIDNNELTPDKFSWKFFWSQPSNRLSLFLSFSAIIVALRFTQEMMEVPERTMYIAFVIGLSVDFIIKKIEDNYLK
jgi:hypothetical protein